MNFKHVVMTFNREIELNQVVQSLLNITSSNTIVLYDSGRRSTIKRYAKKMGIRYVRSPANSAKENLALILEQEKDPIFIHHDDDLVLSTIKNAKRIIQSNNIQFATSLKIHDPNFPLKPGMSKKNKINKLLELYFLSANRNCPLLSGLFIDNRSKWNFCKKYQIPGRHDDVGMILDLLTRKGSYIFPQPYIAYSDDTVGENSTRCLEDRRHLSNFLHALPIKRSTLYSLLSTVNGPHHRYHFLKLFWEMLKNPQLVHKLIHKAIRR